MCVMICDCKYSVSVDDKDYNIVLFLKKGSF